MKKPLSQAARKRISQARKEWWAAKKKKEGLQLVPKVQRVKSQQEKSKSVYSTVIDLLVTEIETAREHLSKLEQARVILEELDMDEHDKLAA